MYLVALTGVPFEINPKLAPESGNNVSIMFKIRRIASIL